MSPEDHVQDAFRRAREAEAQRIREMTPAWDDTPDTCLSIARLDEGAEQDDWTPTEQAHLARCHRCRRTLELARAFPDPVVFDTPARRPRLPPRWVLTTLAGLAAACVLVVALFALWPTRTHAPPGVVRYDPRKTTGTLGGGPHPNAETWKNVIAFPGSGYVYLLSLTPDGKRSVDPHDAAQKEVVSDDQFVSLRTFFPTGTRRTVLVCVVDRPAGELLEKALKTAAIAPDGDPRQTAAAVRRAVEKALAGKQIQLIAFSPEARVLTDS
jgi:hypothetical protein